MSNRIINKVASQVKKAISAIKKYIFYIVLFGIYMLLVFLVIYVYFDMQAKRPNAPKPYFILFLIPLFTFVFTVAVWARKENARINEKYSSYEKYLKDKRDGKSISAKDGGENQRGGEEDGENKDAINDMLKNNMEIIEYFGITKRQEKISYIISIICAGIGVIMLIVSAVAVFVSERIETTIITVVGGAITEAVSGIVLWIHNKSAMQLNYYYDALHENEKFLSAISLADKLGPGEKSQMYMEIIRAQIGAGKEEPSVKKEGNEE